MVINKFPNREVYEKIKEKGSLGADDVNVLEDYSGLEWKGEYSSTATYVKGDIVYYENMLYVMVSASVIGAIPGIDNDWIDFAKRSVTSSDVTNALGFTPADSTKVLPLSGGTLTGNLTGKYITGTWLQATDAGHLATTPTKIPVFDDKGWIYYRTPAEILKDIGASSGYTLTEADKLEIAGKVTADGMEFTLADLPAGGPSGSGGALKAMSAVSGYIGIPAAELPENGVVWMCIADGATNQEYYSGTITMQGGALSSNNMVSISSNGVIQLNQVAQVSDGIAIYGMSASAYTGVYQVAGAGGAAEAWEEIRTLELSEDVTKVTISTDNSGNTFTLKSAYIKVKAVPPTNESITYNASVCVGINGQDPWVNTRVVIGESPKYGEAKAMLLFSIWDTYAGKFIPIFVKRPQGQTTHDIVVSGRQDDYSGAGAIHVTNDDIQLESPCSSISIGSYRTTLYSGSVIKIYGVRA